MAQVPLPMGPLEDTLLCDISNFVRDRPNSSYSSLICFSHDYSAPGNLGFTIELRRDSRKGERLRHDHVAEGSAMQVVRILVECPTWTHAQFAFDGRGLAALVLETFSLLRASRSLSTLDIRLNHLYGRFLPTLLCDNPFLETLILNPGGTCNLEDAERLAHCFAWNSVLKSCTLKVDSGRNFQIWETLFRPFTACSKSESNLSLKELVVVEPQKLNWSAANLRYFTCGDSLTNLVSFNTTIEKLDLRMSRYSDIPINWAAALSFSRALAVNHTLKEFCCYCSLAQLRELVGVFIPKPSGLQANTYLTTLRLLPSLTGELKDYLQELSRMIELNTTLKHVEVLFSGIGPISSSMIWEVRSIKPLQCALPCTQDILEKMMSKELTVNTSLQSLVVGSWKLLRVGGHWHLSYGGPCLVRQEFVTAEYDVRIKMR